VLSLSGERLWKFLFGAAAVAGGLAVFFVAQNIPVGFSYDSAGPRLLPYLVAIGLSLSGIGAMFEAALQPPTRAADQQHYDMLPVVMILGALLLEALLIRWLGWIPVAAGVFMAGAYAMGSRRLLRDAFTGVVFGAVTLALFNLALGLHLPLGVIEPILGLVR
jgi:putative tricarboxylic transport membrane protein